MTVEQRHMLHVWLMQAVVLARRDEWEVVKDRLQMMLDLMEEAGE